MGRTLGLVLLALELAEGAWEQLPDIPRQGNYAYPHGGSGMCTGPYEGRASVWLLYGSLENNGRYHGYLARYDIASREWFPLRQMPQGSFCGWGGAIVYVPMPGATPEGLLFALKGNRTSEFYAYNPLSDLWYAAPDLSSGGSIEPDVVTVDSGGALCFGGFREREGRQYAVIYALSGFAGAGSPGRFFEYSFEYVPFDGPVNGRWTELPNLPQTVSAGGALAFQEAANGNPDEAMLLALTGYGSRKLWQYDFDVQDWYQPTVDFASEVLSGGAMCTDIDRGQAHGLFGGHSATWWTYDPISGAIDYLPIADNEVEAGGSTVAYEGGYLYAQFGNHARFFRYDFASPTRGGQSQGGAQIVNLRMRQVGRIVEISFSGIREPVSVRLADAAGRVVVRAFSVKGPGDCRICIPVQGLRSGVYICVVQGQQCVGRGRAVIVR